MPDEQRVLEATGNEGATFERFYHRAALVIWPREAFVDVLLQAGPRAAVPYLERRVAALAVDANPGDERAGVLAEARRVVAAWESGGRRVDVLAGDDWDEDHADVVDDLDDDEPLLEFIDDADDALDDEDGFDEHVDADGLDENGAEMRTPAHARTRLVTVLAALGDAALLERFVAGPVTTAYDGREAAVLAAAVPLLGAKRSTALLSQLVRRHAGAAPRGCVALLRELVQAEHARRPKGRAAWLREIAAVLVDALSELGRESRPRRTAREVDASLLADLLDVLALLGAPRLRAAACTAVIENVTAFEPQAVIVPALGRLAESGRAIDGDSEAERLWRHAAHALLERSEHPPAPPRDWRQDVALGCDCADCRELAAFAADPVERVRRLPLREDRRRHLHEQIRRRGLDMTHETERKGRPFTLVCTKTRWSFERRVEAHARDVAALEMLAGLVDEPPLAFKPYCDRIAAVSARGRAPGAA